MSNKDTGIRPTIPGQSVRAIHWHHGEDKEPELYGPVGIYIGSNDDENADDDQNSIFDLFGERIIGDKHNGYAVVEDKPHTTEAFETAVASFVEAYPVGNQGIIVVPTEEGGITFQNALELVKSHGDTWVHRHDNLKFHFNINEAGIINVLFYSSYDTDNHKHRFFVPVSS